MGHHNSFAYCSAPGLDQSCTSKNMILYLRLKLDCFLRGIVSDEVRRKLVERFVKDEEANSFAFTRDIKRAFLSIVLDESFSELKMVVNSDGDHLSTVMAMVAKRSPLLNKLVLKVDRFDCTLTVGFLANLRVLSIEQAGFLAGKSEYLACLGTSCPGLVNLSLRNFDLKLKEILNIFLGENAAAVEIPENHLHEYQFVPGTLVPFCNTLTSIQFDYQETEDCTFPDNMRIRIPPS